MKIENLKVGQIIKNYKELCNILEMKVSAGNSKKKQLNELERYCKYHKDKNKFIIDGIYDTPLPKMNNNSKYINEIQIILTYYLFEHKEDSKVILSISELINILGLANDTYSIGTYKKKELSDLLDIKLPAIHYFYNTTRTEFKNIINRALKNLENRSAILSNIVYMICTLDKQNKKINKRIANEDEIKLILDTERLVLDSMNFATKKELFLAGVKAYKDFTKLVNAELPKEWDFYYKAYNIYIGKYAIISELTKVLCEKSNLNNKLVNRVKHLLKVDKNFNKHTIENMLINKLISFEGYDDELNEALKQLYLHNKAKYYKNLQNIDKQRNEVVYQETKIKEDYENKDVIELKDYLNFKHELKYINSLPDNYSKNLNERIFRHFFMF